MKLSGYDSLNTEIAFEDRCRIENLTAILKRETTRESPIVSERLEPRIGLHGKSAGQRFRDLVSHMRANMHLPVGSGSLGYFWARNRAELESTKQHLNERCTKIHAVIAGLEQAFPIDDQETLL